MPVKPKVFKPAKFGKDIRPKETSWGQGRGGRPWRRLRAFILHRDSYECQQCLRELNRHVVADEVDHKIPRAEGGTDDENNLEAICSPHHEVKTLQEAKRGVARYKSNSHLANKIL